jgi:hypothetical protein
MPASGSTLNINGAYDSYLAGGGLTCNDNARYAGVVVSGDWAQPTISFSVHAVTYPIIKSCRVGYTVTGQWRSDGNPWSATFTANEVSGEVSSPGGTCSSNAFRAGKVAMSSAQ